MKHSSKARLSSGPRLSRMGFTMMEMIVAVSISLVVLLGSTQFFISSYKVLLRSESTLEANFSVRQFLTELQTVGNSSTGFTLYPSFSTAVREKESWINVGYDGYNGDGDFLIFVNSENFATETKYYDLTLYRVVGKGDDVFDVQKCFYKVPTAMQSQSYETILAYAASTGKFTIAFESVRRIKKDEGFFMRVNLTKTVAFQGVRVRFPEQLQPSKVMQVMVTVRG